MKPLSLLPARRGCGWVLGVGWALFGSTASWGAEMPPQGVDALGLTGQLTFRDAYIFEITGWGAASDPASLVPNALNFGQVVSSPRMLPESNRLGGNDVLLHPEYPSFAVLTNSIQITANTVGVACGEKHTLLLKRDGTVQAVGSGQSGQLEVPWGLSNAVAVAAGTDHSLALRSDGRVVAWGWNHAGQACVPPDLSGVMAIAAGRDYSLALRNDGTVRAWGGVPPGSSEDADDRFEGGEMEPPSEVRKVQRNPVIAIAAGVRHALALRSDGSVVGWGSNWDRRAWEVPSGFGPFAAVSAGSGFSVGLRRDRTVQAWGDNRYHQLDVPPELKDVIGLACGSYHTVALRANGSVVVWGNNASGQTTLPPAVGQVVAIAAGGVHSEILEHGGPLMTDPRITEGRFRCELNLPAGQRYRLQASTDLRGWVTLKADTAFPMRMGWDGLVRLEGAAFYRVQPVWPGDPDYVSGYYLSSSRKQIGIGP